ncbi:MAG: Na(+)/H(+) antiporter subunit D [Acidobacteria bacterium]|jgi:multicomponent Na+:H+ antiporter subunit D|nr:Na(+)/H(+) antiporter subunit D [Acidobacteriota bacterium]
MSEWIIPPGLIMIAGAVLLPVLPKKLRSLWFIVTSLAALVAVFSIPEGANLAVKFLEYRLVVVKMDALSRLFGIIFAFIALVGGIYSFHVKEVGQQMAALLYAGSSLGVTFAGDFFTLFICWEIMAITSTYLVWARRTKEAQRAGLRYLLYHILGGGILFMGILWHLSTPGNDILVSAMTPDMGISVWLILLGVMINAAIPPLHTWLPDAYPQATVTGAVFMSAFTTKVSVYLLARVFPGWEILLIAGTVMILYGIIYAILANDIRGILSYHIISQVGYMVAGVGIGTVLGINGAVSHAFNNILFKSALFMGAGLVLFATGTGKLSELGGLLKKQRLAFWLYMIAGFSISGVPLFNGYISKSMTVAAAGEAHHEWAVLLMNLAAIGTFLSVGLKLPYFTWVAKEKEKSNDVKPIKAPVNMYIAMIILAAACVAIGVYPTLLYRWLPGSISWNPFTLEHLAETVQILVFTFVVFWVSRKIMEPKAKITLDLDWFYRRPAGWFGRTLVDPWNNSFDWIEAQVLVLARNLADWGKNPFVVFTKNKPRDFFSPDHHRSSAQKLILIALGLVIIIFFLGYIF